MRPLIFAVVILTTWAGSAEGAASYTAVLASYCRGYWESVTDALEPLIDKQHQWLETNCSESLKNNEQQQSIETQGQSLETQGRSLDTQGQSLKEREQWIYQHCPADNRCIETIKTFLKDNMSYINERKSYQNELQKVFENKQNVLSSCIDTEKSYQDKLAAEDHARKELSRVNRYLISVIEANQSELRAGYFDPIIYEIEASEKQGLEDSKTTQNPNVERQSAAQRLARCLDPNALPF